MAFINSILNYSVEHLEMRHKHNTVSSPASAASVTQCHGNSSYHYSYIQLIIREVILLEFLLHLLILLLIIDVVLLLAVVVTGRVVRVPQLVQDSEGLRVMRTQLLAVERKP